jgi:hypothetical protein
MAVLIAQAACRWSEPNGRYRKKGTRRRTGSWVLRESKGYNLSRTGNGIDTHIKKDGSRMVE